MEEQVRLEQKFCLTIANIFSKVCFSFGTFWNKGSYTISLGHLTNHPDSNSLERVSDETWQYLETIEASSQTAKASSIVVETKRATTIIPRVRLSTSQDFSTILSSSQPVILEGLELGACTTLWTNDYLKDRIGNERKVTMRLQVWNIHVLKLIGCCSQRFDNSHGLHLEEL